MKARHKRDRRSPVRKTEAKSPARCRKLASTQLADIIDETLFEKVTVFIDGRRQRIPAIEVLYRQFWVKELAGDRFAMGLRLDYEKYYCRPDRNPNRQITIIGGLPDRKSDFSKEGDASHDRSKGRI